MRNPTNIVIVIVIVLIPILSALYVYGTGDTATVVVKRIDHKVYKSGDSVKDKYLVFTEHNGVFENTDCFLRFKFDSSDLQNSLTEEKRYIIGYYGWRVPFLSWYPNIYSVTAVRETVPAEK